MTRHKTEFLRAWTWRLTASLLILIPFHAFLTVWLSQVTGQYTLLRLWDEALLVVIVAGTGLLLIHDTSARQSLKTNLLFKLIAVYIGLSLLLGMIALFKGEVTTKALGYGLIVNLRFLIWFGAVWIVARMSPALRSVLPKLLLIPAIIVIVFAVLQYTLLPHNFLARFGYDERSTIAPIETINNNAEYIRVQSTLRGANPLGAYLIIPLAILSAVILRHKKRFAYVVLGLAGFWALYASGSRSAWIGAALAGVITVFCLLRTRKAKHVFGIATISVLLIGGLFAGLTLRHSTDLQNALLHTQENSEVATGSNSAHFDALSTGIRDISRLPFGDGPGTAGPASTYNSGHAPRIAENYYIQIGQETGWIGIGLFSCIIVLVAWQLWKLRHADHWAVIAFATLVGICFVNLLSHAWTDDTLAYVWWGLAAIVLGTASAQNMKMKRLK